MASHPDFSIRKLGNRRLKADPGGRNVSGFLNVFAMDGYPLLFLWLVFLESDRDSGGVHVEENRFQLGIGRDGLDVFR